MNCMRTVVVIGHYGMGHGSSDLAIKILGTFLRKCVAMEQLEAVVLFNDGVKLAVDGSPVLGELQQLHERGVEILPCGTCLDFFGLTSRLKVAGASNMDAIVAELDRAEKVITL